MTDYEKFQLEWMISHGYSLNDLITALTDYRNEQDDADALYWSPSETFDSWEDECGFGSGSLWPCEAEFNQVEAQMPKTEKISVSTTVGRLEACIGGDRDYPEIFTYLVRPDGVEIDLACVSGPSKENERETMEAYLYEDTSTDQWTRKFSWTKEELSIEE